MGCKFSVQKKAIVYWPQRATISAAFFQFFNYAYGDGKAFYIRFQTPFLYLRYIVGLGMFAAGYIYPVAILFMLYLAWSVKKNYKYVNNMHAVFYLPILQIISDIAVLLGTSLGLFAFALKRIMS